LIILSASLPFVAMTFNGRCVAQEPIQESQSEPLEWHQVFEKADSWSATMLHCRNRFKSFLATGPIDKAFPAVDLTLRRIRVADPDFGVYEERVMRDWSELPLPGVTDSESRPTTALDWFRSTDTTIDRALIGMVLSRTESECEIAKRATSPLRMRLAALQNEDASANDPRWLELYCDATDTEMLLTPLQGLDTFQDSAKTIREAFGAKCTFTCNEVQEKQEKMDARWNVLFDRATVSPTKLTALLDEYATLRNEVRFGITSVRRAMSDSELVNLQTEWEEQLKDLENELRRRDWYAREAVIRQTLHPAALVFPEDRDSVDIAVRLRRMGRRKRDSCTTGRTRQDDFNSTA
jgi:hypothetical protein